MRGSMKTQRSDFKPVFDRLCAILEPYAGRLRVSVKSEDEYCLEIPFSKRFSKALPAAWVKISKSYVSFHFMPVYFAPELQKSLSPALKARMQGKSCFNFKAVDEKLFQELRQLVSKGFDLSKKMNVV
jgi:hypothetical protein